MTVVAVVMSILLAAVFLLVGMSKILRRPQMVASAEHLGYSTRAYQGIGTLEVAGAAGLIIGIFWHPLGIAAAAGLFLLMIGAVVSHVRAGDGVKVFFPALWLSIVSVATGIILIIAN